MQTLLTDKFIFPSSLFYIFLTLSNTWIKRIKITRVNVNCTSLNFREEKMIQILTGAVESYVKNVGRISRSESPPTISCIFNN